jgi:peptide/nickel transport system substrate-binding protein
VKVSQASGSFLKKRTKKLLLNGWYGNTGANAPSESKFSCFFLFTKRSAFLLVFLLRALSAHAAPPGNCGTIVIPTGLGVAPSADITSMNPMLVTAIYNQEAASLLYLGLIWIGRDAKIDYSRSLASAITSPDNGTTYDVTLRPWHWSDGTLVTTADVAYTWKLINQLGTTYAGYGAGGMPDIVKSLKVISPTQFEVVLKHSVNTNWYIYNGLSAFEPLPAHSWGKYTTDQIWQAQSSPDFYNVVDGPVKIQQLNIGLDAVFVPNPAYEGPKMHFDRLVFKFFHTDGASLQQVESGDLDMANAPLAFWGAIQHVAGLHVVSLPPSLGFNEVSYNFRDDRVAFLRDVRVRQAITDAIDQNEIVKLVYHGQGEPVYGPVPPNPPTFLSPEMRAGHYPVGYDPAKSRALLAAAGFSPGPDGIMVKNGQKLSFTTLFPSGDATADQDVLFEQASLRKVGIEEKIQNIEFNQMLALIENPKAHWEAATLGLTIGGYPSGEDLFAPGAYENMGGYNDPKMNAYIAESTDKPGLQGLYDYENYASEQQPIMFQQKQAIPLLVADRIQNAASFVDPAGQYYPDQLYCTVPPTS